MWIGGEWVDADSGKTFLTHNPATGEVVAQVPEAGLSDVDRAVVAARSAFPAWSKKSQAERSAVVARIAAAVREYSEDLARLEVLEHGATLAHAPSMLYFAAENIDLAASSARTLMGKVLPGVPSMGNEPGAPPDTVVYLKREPMGVCALITPWNVPSLLIATKLGFSLATGNTCVIKPPSINSGIGLKWAEILDELDLPPGVVNIITGPGSSIGDALSRHPDVDFVGFTGSSEVGKDIIAASSQTMKRVMMELGGKNAAIILEDADVAPAAEELCMIAFQNVGQNCAQPSRFYVHEKIYDEFLEKFRAAAQKIRVGDPSDPDTVMGPVASREQRDSIEYYIKTGLDEGAQLVLGGTRPSSEVYDKGFYVMPTIFSKCTPEMTISREEVFGPVVGFFKFSSDEEVLTAANDSVFGLCASVWTRDYARGIRFVNDLKVGAVWINQHMNLVPETPWGGWKESGLGKEGGIIGPEGYTQMKYVCIKHS